MKFKAVLFKRTCESEGEKGIVVTKSNDYKDSKYVILTENLEVVNEVWDFIETKGFVLNLNFKDVYGEE